MHATLYFDQLYFVLLMFLISLLRYYMWMMWFHINVISEYDSYDTMTNKIVKNILDSPLYIEHIISLKQITESST